MVSATRDDEIVILSGAGDENNGQALRIAVTLSAITRTSVIVKDIRALKKTPGTEPSRPPCSRPQRLCHAHNAYLNETCLGKTSTDCSTGMTTPLIAIVKWLAEATEAETEGNVLQSDTLTFRPKRHASPKLIRKEIKINPGSMNASSVLYFQTILPLLLYIGGDPKSEKPIELRIDGATNCPEAPSYEYLDQVFLPALEKYFGIVVARKMERRGWSQLTPDPRTVQKGTIRFKLMPLEWATTLQFQRDAKLCDEEEEDPKARQSDGHTGVRYVTRSLDNFIQKVVATLVTPSGMHEPLKDALVEDIENRFPDAGVEFRTEDSGHCDRVYVLLVAHAEYCRWGRDLIMAKRLKDANVDSLAKEISSKLSKDLEDEVNGEVGGECPIDTFLQDQLVIYQCLAEERSCFPRQRKDQTTEFALSNLQISVPLKKDATMKLPVKNSGSNDSKHTHLARYAASMMLPNVKWYNEGKICKGAGIKAGDGKDQS